MIGPWIASLGACSMIGVVVLHNLRDYMPAPIVRKSYLIGFAAGILSVFTAQALL